MSQPNTTHPLFDDRILERSSYAMTWWRRILFWFLPQHKHVTQDGVVRYVRWRGKIWILSIDAGRSELWPRETDPDYLRSMKRIPEPQRTAMILGEPETLSEREWEIIEKYMKYERFCEELLCPIDTEHGPMPATREQHKEYNKRLNEKERELCISYNMERSALRKLIKDNRHVYERAYGKER